MSQTGGLGQRPYRWGGVPPLFAGDVFHIARRLAAHGMGADEIRRVLTRVHGGEGGVRSQEIGRAATNAVVWAAASSAAAGINPEAPILRDYAMRTSGIPQRYRYVVDVLVDPASAEWRTVAVDSETRLTWNAVRLQAAFVFSQMSQDYARDARFQVNEDSTMVFVDIQRAR